MGIFSDLNERISANIARHGHYLSRPDADHAEKLEETVDLLMNFVRPEARDEIKSQVLGLIYEHRNLGLDIGQDPPQPR